VPDRSTLKGKRDYVITALLVGCALRRRELATLNIEDIPLREGRWVVIDLRGKGWPYPHGRSPDLGEAGNRSLDGDGQDRQGRLLRPL